VVSSLYISLYFTCVEDQVLKITKFSLAGVQAVIPAKCPTQSRVNDGFRLLSQDFVQRGLENLKGRLYDLSVQRAPMFSYPIVIFFFPFIELKPLFQFRIIVSWCPTVHLCKDLVFAILASLQAMEGCCQVSSEKFHFSALHRVSDSVPDCLCSQHLPSLSMSFWYWEVSQHQEFLKEIPNLSSFHYEYPPFLNSASRHKVLGDLV